MMLNKWIIQWFWVDATTKACQIGLNIENDLNTAVLQVFTLILLCENVRTNNTT